MSFMNWFKGMRSSVTPAASSKKAFKSSVPVTGKSASQLATELKNRGDGSMAGGITKTQQKGYWQGRADQKRIDQKSK